MSRRPETEPDRAEPWWSQHQLLGAGSFASVYGIPARRTPAGLADMALKLPHQSISDRHRRHWKSLAWSLRDHRVPGLVGLHPQLDAPEEGLWMDWLPGRLLSEALESEHLPLPLGAWLLQSLCRSAQGLTELGLQHRDLHPGNILIGTDRVPRIIDLERACCLDSASRGLELPGPGKRRYQPPERSDGLEHPRGDIFSLGVLAWEIWTAAPMEEPPSSPREFEDWLRAGVDAMASARAAGAEHRRAWTEGTAAMLSWEADARPSPRDCVCMWSALGSSLAGGRLGLEPHSPPPGQERVNEVAADCVSGRSPEQRA